MNRIAYVVLKKIYIAPYWFLKICFYSRGSKYNRKEKYSLIKNIVNKVNKACNVDIICSGEENMPKENGYVLFPNHQGLFDVLLLIDTQKEPFSFVIKKELEKTLLIKQIISLLESKAIDRNDLKQSMKIIIEMTNEVKQGKNFIIFAEGTRSKEPNVPGKFKGGTFKSAVKAKAPIVPVALIDAYKPFDINSTKEVTVQIHYLKPLYYEEYKDMNTLEIANEVRARIVEKIENVLKQQIS